MLGVIVIYVVLFGGLWWFMMRPQKKEQKRIQAMLASMEVGDTALTTSGFYGITSHLLSSSFLFLNFCFFYWIYAQILSPISRVLICMLPSDIISIVR